MPMGSKRKEHSPWPYLMSSLNKGSHVLSVQKVTLSPCGLRFNIHGVRGQGTWGLDVRLKVPVGRERSHKKRW